MDNNIDEPIVSAIITTHNRKDLAEKAINSVLSQIYKNIELIVVDDASEQSISEYFRSMADQKGFTYIYINPEESLGGNHARNVGIDASKGDLIAFLDDDDEWMPEKTTLQLDFLQTHPDYGVVSCLRIKEYDFKKTVVESSKYKIEGDIHESIFASIPYVTSTIMIRRQILEDIGGFDENLRYWQEYDLAIRCAQCTKIGFVNRQLCLYRIIHNDKKRLSNNIDGWESAVKHIDKKYCNIIEKLPKEIRLGRELLIARDGQTRAMNANNRKLAIYYGKNVVRIKPSIKNYIKLIMSVLGIRW